MIFCWYICAGSPAKDRLISKLNISKTRNNREISEANYIFITKAIKVYTGIL